MPKVNLNVWDHFVDQYPDIHILQTSCWGELKSHFGWEVIRLIKGELGAQILIKRLPLGLRFAYIPKGPVGFFEFDRHKDFNFQTYFDSDNWKTFWQEVDQICIENKVSFLKVEPDLWEEDFKLAVIPTGFYLSKNSIQPSRTILIDLLSDETELLAQMKQKTRYNIRLSQKKGVTIQTGNDIQTFYNLVQNAGKRDKFGVHSFSYYQNAFQLCFPKDLCQLFFAQYQEKTLAAIMVFKKGKIAWFFYGGSSNLNRELMPSYLIQWQAMLWAKSKGCLIYDLWGIPNFPENELENRYLNQKGGLWGVYRFKRGFGGVIHRAVGPWDRVYSKSAWLAYNYWMNWHHKINE